MAWGDRYNVDQLTTAAARHWSGDLVPIAVAVALAESQGEMVKNDRPGETPSSRRGIERCASYGPWQINYCPGRDAGTAREAAATTPSLAVHADVAHRVYRSQGWSAWTQYRNGTYRQYLDRARGGTATSPGTGELTPVDGQGQTRPALSGIHLPGIGDIPLPGPGAGLAEGLGRMLAPFYAASAQIARGLTWLADRDNRVRVAVGLAGFLLLAAGAIVILYDLGADEAARLADAATGGTAGAAADAANAATGG